jgi:hypothetical protein
MATAINKPPNFGQGEVYKLTSPHGKIYMGQAACYLNSKNGKYVKYGTHGRWIGHKSDARRIDGGNCTDLNKEIRLHDFENFDVVIIGMAQIGKKLNDMETSYIAELKKTIDPDMILNIHNGGNCGPLALSTRTKMSINRLAKPCFQQPHSEQSKQLIREALIDIVVRYGHTGGILPKYVKYTNRIDRVGYELVSHPTIKNKSFTSVKKTLDERYDECIAYMGTATHYAAGVNNRKSPRSKPVKK